MCTPIVMFSRGSSLVKRDGFSFEAEHGIYLSVREFGLCGRTLLMKLAKRDCVDDYESRDGRH